METYVEGRPLPPDFVLGMGSLTFGLVVGFSMTAMPFLLSKAGVSVDRIAAISATAMSPTFFAFLLTPIVDDRRGGHSDDGGRSGFIAVSAVVSTSGDTQTSPDGNLRRNVPQRCPNFQTTERPDRLSAFPAARRQRGRNQSLLGTGNGF